MKIGDLFNESEFLNLIKSTADTLDKLVANFTNVKEKHSSESIKVIEAVEGAFE